MKRTAGGYSTVFISTVPVANRDVRQVTAGADNLLSFCVNGALIHSFTDTSYAAATRVGVRAGVPTASNGTASLVRWDDVTVFG